MLNINKKYRIISNTLLVIGVIIIFIIFSSFYQKLIIIIAYFSLIQILSIIISIKHMNRITKLICKCEMNEARKILEKDLTNNKNIFTSQLIYNLLMCYLYLNDKENLIKIIKIYEEEFNTSKNTVFKIKKCYTLAVVYYNLKNEKKASEYTNYMERLLKTVNLDSSSSKEELINNYHLIRNKLDLFNDEKNKDILIELKDYYLNLQSDILLHKVKCADELVTIYEKLGDKEKAKEYAKFLIENHKDYYVDPKRITKYSTLIKKGKL